jgi:lipopolysaccharide/colanic/teichoic acid biosynthesis glycosyltransferase
MMFDSRGLSLRIKRALDLVGSVTGLALSSPIMLLAAAAIWAEMGRPVLFSQLRPGKKSVPFRIYKFRTMVAPKQGEKWFRSDAKRLTKLGDFLRRSSIDELPELFNVLKGEMSLVGPRPLLIEYLEKYTPEEARRHDVSPGITGWAQVNGRQTIKFSERLRLDVWYVDNWSLGLDLKILMKTMCDVFATKDVLPGQNVDDVDDIGLSADRERV